MPQSIELAHFGLPLILLKVKFLINQTQQDKLNYTQLTDDF